MLHSVQMEVVMAGHSRPKDSVLSHAYVPAIHVFLFVAKSWMPSEVGLARLPRKLAVTSAGMTVAGT